MADKALILGGYGAAGRAIARLLLRETSLDVTLAGRDAKQASAAAAELGSDRVGAAQVDANDTASLGAGLEGCDLIIVCIPLEGIAHGVAQTAIEAGIDWIDISLGPLKAQALQLLTPRIEQSGRCFVTEAGALPGLPSALVRLAADRLGEVRAAAVSALIKESDSALGSALDMVRQVATPASVHEAGGWRRASLMATRSFDFGDPFGTHRCFPTDLIELRELPEQLGMERLAAYVAGVNPVVDLLLMTFATTGLGRFDSAVRACARLMVRANRRFTRAPHGVRIKLEAEGSGDGAPRRLDLLVSHEDGYEITAIPLVACLLQLLDGSIRRPGLHYMGCAVDPRRLLEDMRRLGAGVSGI